MSLSLPRGEGGDAERCARFAVSPSRAFLVAIKRAGFTTGIAAQETAAQVAVALPQPDPKREPRVISLPPRMLRPLRPPEPALRRFFARLNCSRTRLASMKSAQPESFATSVKKSTLLA
jgi:hypothetical protein